MTTTITTSTCQAQSLLPLEVVDSSPPSLANAPPLSVSTSYHFHESSVWLGDDSSSSSSLDSAIASPQDNGDVLAAAGSSQRTSRRPVASLLASTTATPSAADNLKAADLFSADEEPRLSPQFVYDYHSNMPVITKRELANAINLATSIVDRRLAPAKNLDNLPGTISGDQLEADNAIDLMEFGSAGWLASSMFHKPAPQRDQMVWNQTRQSMISEEATRLLAKQYKLARHQVLRGLPLISVESSSLGKQCPRQLRQFSCVPGRYRSFSGHCNNVQNPDWAAAQTALARYAPASYTDHISRPVASSDKWRRTAGDTTGGAHLPSARQISLAIQALSPAPTANGQHSHMTTMLSFFGQFVFHDLSFVAQFSKSIKCCKTSQLHPECMPIKLDGQPTSDSSAYCLDYIRSATAVRNGCNLGARDQLNLVSSYLDGSVIYGSSESQAHALRSFEGGRLRSQRIPIGTNQQQQQQQQPNVLELLPQIKLNETDDAHWLAAFEECKQVAQMRMQQQQQQQQQRRRQQQAVSSGSTVQNCFQAGDIRVNQNIGLTLMHTIWLREHNNIADQLARLNPHWADERLFEETRRIVVAELQHITYSEFLPSILGDEVMQRFNLSTLGQGYNENYEPQLNAAVSNELATSVFPFILSTIPETLERYSERLEMLGSTQLSDTFMDASELFKRNKFAQYLTGMMSQNAMEPALGLLPATMEPRRDASQPQSTNGTGTGAGPPQVDATAIILQQGRDHGIKAYVYWRRVCQLKPTIRNWADLAQVMPAEVVAQLRQFYVSVDQLELYLALLETPAPGATVGPTFVCLLARQFHHLKFGDRFWFENDLPGLSFSARQLDEIRQTSLAKLICRNSQSSISFIQPSPMISSDPFLNAYQYCSNKAMGQLDLSKWRQPITSAQQVSDEKLLAQLVAAGANSRPPSLARGKRLIEEHSLLMSENVEAARGQLDLVAKQEASRIRKAMALKVRAKRQANGPQIVQADHNARTLASYRHLPRPKRQALALNNQSVIFELATNEVVRSLLRQGKDREQAQSIQMDIRDFLYTLENIQLENLLHNSAAKDSLGRFISSANSGFLSSEQRSMLAAAGDPILVDSADPVNEILPANSEQAMSCQDDDRAWPCDHTSPFRTITGWCNNLQQPKFGQSFTVHDRILASAYEDGFSRPRSLSSVKRGDERLPLPSPRLISTTMHEDRPQPHVRYSLALMQFGQFGVDHDLTNTPMSVALDGSLLDCSSCDSRTTVHRDCLPIEVPLNDSYYMQESAVGTGSSSSGNQKRRQKCLNFVRSLNGQTGLGPRQQINALTSYIDGSEIYGSDNCEAKSLRAFQGGRLNSSNYPAQAAQSAGLNYLPREILPLTRANPECVTPNGFCFHAGDQRASEQPGLTSMHTIFLRLHNSIVGQLAQINRHWNDEKLYQTGRRIVGAILQRITYNEFAPRLLGLDYMSRFDLILKQVGYSDDYDDSCSASILTEFAAAAFRMGHSLIRGSFPLLNKHYKPITVQANGNGNNNKAALQLRTAFFNSQRILTEPQLIDSILRGIVSTPIESLDNSVTQEISNHLFERPRVPFSGMDLIALNIQRARDHGIGPYNSYRVRCNLTRALTFDDLAGEIPNKLIKRLATLYGSVDDIDLFTGGLSELPVHGGIIGPTFGCIIGMQLRRLKQCDRFWHETGDPFVRLSVAQLAEIRKMSLAKVICSQSDQIESIQRNAMDLPDDYLNPRVACSSLASMDLAAWRENQKACQLAGGKTRLELGHTRRVSACKSCTCTLEGPVCRSAKIDCLKMVRKLSGQTMGQIMADKSCLVQCAWALDMQQQQRLQRPASAVGRST